MLSSQHAIVGSVIAVATGNPALGFIGGVASHHLLDCLPHYDGGLEKHENRRYSKKEEKWSKQTYILAVTDSIVTLIILLTVSYLTGRWLLVFIGATGGVLPDFLDNVPWWKNQFRKTFLGKKWHRVHEICHFRWKNVHVFNIILAALMQVAITVGGIWFLLKNY